jgi:hypothetical protein
MIAFKPGLPKPTLNITVMKKNRNAPPRQMMIDGIMPFRVKPLFSDT